MGIKKILKKFLPQFFLKFLRKPAKYGFFGDYGSWEDARRDSKGYDSPVIFEKMKISALKIKAGEIGYERDTIVFAEHQENKFVIEGVLDSINEGSNVLLDFGGSFGNVYFQHKHRVNSTNGLKWIVIEQPHIAEFGKEEFANDNLFFYTDDQISFVLNEHKPSIALFGSSIQYAQKPYEVLELVTRNGVENIIVDRTPLFEDASDNERIVVQRVRPEIYDASYPAHILNLSKIKKFMKDRSYEVIEEARQGYMALDGTEKVALRGIIFKLNK